MRTIGSIFRFVFLDNLRSVWAIMYSLFFAGLTYSLIYFMGSFSRSVASLMNVVILIAPLVSTMMTSMYYYNKTDFLYLLLAQPVKRMHVFLGMYLGIALTHCLAVGLGLGVGILFATPSPGDWPVLLVLILSGILLSLVFSSMSFFLSVASKDKLKGIGIALAVWLFMAVIYDGLMLMYFIVFSEYPIEDHAIILSVLNPIDLARIFIMLKLDEAALMGYSGAVFAKFFGSNMGMLFSVSSLLLWVVGPLLSLARVSRKKDF